MAELTTAQRTDMQGDLGISADESVFEDTELDRLYTRAGEDYALAVYYGYRQLLASANKLHDYTAGQSRMSKSQVRDHVKDSLELWADEARKAGNQVRMASLRGVPPKHKDKPDV